MQSSSIPELDVAATTTATAATSINTKKKKRRRSKKSSNTSEINAQDNNDNIKTSILNSNLSLKKHTQLKKLTKLTPWYDINELISVGNGLLLALKLFPSPSFSSSIATPPFSSSIQQSQQPPPQVAGLTNEEYNQLKLALHTVAIWRGKSDKGGRLSHAIDITAGLASVLLMDAERTSSASSMVSTSTNIQTQTSSTIIPTIYQIRSTYSTLLLRSVNGLADTYRHSSKSNTLSVSYCCKLAGLPLWIVDIRHDASHNDLPTLGVCRIGALESLKFWSGRYWKLLEGKCYGNGDISSGISSVVGEDMKENGIYTLALDCLFRYQNAAVKEVCEQSKKKGEKRKAVMESTLQGLEAVAGEDNDNTSMPSNTKDGKSNSGEKQATSKTSAATGSANPWSILDDDKPKKKRKKSKKDDNDETPVSMGDNKPVTPANSQEDTTQTTNPPPLASSRDCAAEFIRTIPIDIAYSTAIQVLVWGRTGMNASEGNTNVNGPALLTLPSVLDLQSSSNNSNNTQSSSSSQEFDASFEQLRIMYEPLIIAITNVYPGFITALFVHLIDSILCLDKARRQSQQQQEGNLDLRQLELHTQYILRWVCHILSRAFHMHFDKSVAILTPKIDQSVVIKPPLQTETAAAAADTVSEQADEDKIFTPQPIDLKKKGRKKWTQVQLEYMQRPLDYSSLQDMGFPLNSLCDRILSHHQDIESGTAVRELKQHLEDIIGKERVVFMGIYGQQSVVASEEPDHGTIGSASSANVKPPQEVPTEDENNILSLEDMEAMLDKDTTTKKDDDDDDQVGSDEPKSTLPSRVVPWTLCKSWDACAIGALPGYPM